MAFMMTLGFYGRPAQAICFCDPSFVAACACTGMYATYEAPLFFPATPATPGGWFWESPQHWTTPALPDSTIVSEENPITMGDIFGGGCGCPKPGNNSSSWIMRNMAHQFYNHRRWFYDLIWETIVPQLHNIGVQIESFAMFQMATLGSFLDAKHQMESQRLIQVMKADSFRDYYPSEGVCTIGTTIRSIMATDRRGDDTVAALSQSSIKRQLLSANRNSTEGPAEDREGRFRQFREKYCEAKDNNAGLQSLCAAAVPQLRKNKDVDYARTLASPVTLDIDFSDAALTEAEEDIMALAANLYAHDIFRQIPEGFLGRAENTGVILDTRSIIAKRSVAEQSFYAIAALKTHGVLSAANRTYLLAVMTEMGFSAAEAEQLLGTNPSYLAQMDLLTRKLFQRPEFYVDLMDKPANTARKSVALQTLSLMQKRELFESTLRSEAVVSMLLELELIKAQDAIQNQVHGLK